MRFVIGFAVLIAALTAAVESASAQNRPWCLRSGFTGPGWCGFDSFQQCMASASGQGGSCIENNMLLWQRQQDQQKKNPQRQGRQDDRRWDGWPLSPSSVPGRLLEAGCGVAPRLRTP